MDVLEWTIHGVDFGYSAYLMGLKVHTFPQECIPERMVGVKVNTICVKSCHFDFISYHDLNLSLWMCWFLFTLRSWLIGQLIDQLINQWIIFIHLGSIHCHFVHLISNSMVDHFNIDSINTFIFCTGGLTTKLHLIQHQISYVTWSGPLRPKSIFSKLSY